MRRASFSRSFNCAVVAPLPYDSACISACSRLVPLGSPTRWPPPHQRPRPPVKWPQCFESFRSRLARAIAFESRSEVSEILAARPSFIATDGHARPPVSSYASAASCVGKAGTHRFIATTIYATCNNWLWQGNPLDITPSIYPHLPPLA